MERRYCNFSFILLNIRPVNEEMFLKLKFIKLIKFFPSCIISAQVAVPGQRNLLYNNCFRDLAGTVVVSGI